MRHGASTAFITLYTKTTGYITGASNEIMIKADRFGDATPADVVKGKTFTSASGLKLTGTKEVSGGLQTQTIELELRAHSSTVWYTRG